MDRRTKTEDADEALPMRRPGMTRHVLKDVPPPEVGQKAVVTVGSRKVVIVNVNGTLRAVGGVCAHQGGPVWMGGVFDEVRARVEPDGRVVEYLPRRGNVIACPWHGWEYDLETGRCLWNSRYRIATYPVERDGDGGIAIWM